MNPDVCPFDTPILVKVTYTVKKYDPYKKILKIHIGQNFHSKAFK